MVEMRDNIHAVRSIAVRTHKDSRGDLGASEIEDRRTRNVEGGKNSLRRALRGRHKRGRLLLPPAECAEEFQRRRRRRSAFSYFPNKKSCPIVIENDRSFYFHLRHHRAGFDFCARLEFSRRDIAAEI